MKHTVPGDRQIYMRMKQWFLIAIAIAFGSVLPRPSWFVLAQSPDGAWTDFENISRTPTSSTFPCIAADAAGNVHVLWSEDVGGERENLVFNSDGTPLLNRWGHQANRLIAFGQTLYYTRWDGTKWLPPVDVHIAPQGYIEYPAAVVDHQGILHVVWISGGMRDGQLYYSRVPMADAMSARYWTKPVVLAEPVVMTYYTTDIVVDLNGGLHVLYFQIGAESGAYVINSLDGGKRWSRPILLYRTSDPYGEQDGVSTVKLVADSTDHLHATWTRYNADGNGEAIFYAQSVDRGQTWSQPFEVATRQPDWYEVDWLNVGVVGNEVHLVWEGGQGAFLNECISHDGGLTWSEPRYILTNLIGENGRANLVVDSANQLHLLVTMRGTAAYLIHGIWYTQWEDSHWQDPILLGTTNDKLYEIGGCHLDRSVIQDILKETFTDGGLRYQRAAVVGGNQLFVVVVDEWNGDIWSSHTTLSAPQIGPQPYPKLTTPTLVPTATSQLIRTSMSTRPAIGAITTRPSSGVLENPSASVLAGVTPSFLLVVVTILIYRLRHRQ